MCNVVANPNALDRIHISIAFATETIHNQLKDPLFVDFADQVLQIDNFANLEVHILGSVVVFVPQGYRNLR